MNSYPKFILIRNSSYMFGHWYKYLAGVVMSFGFNIFRVNHQWKKIPNIGNLALKLNNFL